MIGSLALRAVWVMNLNASIVKSVMTRTYFKDHLEPIREQLRLVDSPRPFPTGWVPGRDELPVTPVSYRETPLPGLPGETGWSG